MMTTEDGGGWNRRRAGCALKDTAITAIRKNCKNTQCTEVTELETVNSQEGNEREKR